MFRRRSAGEPIEQSPFYKFWQEASALIGEVIAGTYELVTPKINGNPRSSTSTSSSVTTAGKGLCWGARTYEAIKAVLETQPIEGIVFHNADGRMRQ